LCIFNPAAIAASGASAMAKAANDYTDILLKKRILSSEQLDEARNLALSTGVKLQDARSKSPKRWPNITACNSST
jgi:hypothetical protein